MPAYTAITKVLCQHKLEIGKADTDPDGTPPDPLPTVDAEYFAIPHPRNFTFDGQYNYDSVVTGSSNGRAISLCGNGTDTGTFAFLKTESDVPVFTKGKRYHIQFMPDRDVRTTYMRMTVRITGNSYEQDSNETGEQLYVFPIHIDELVLAGAWPFEAA